MTTVSSMMKDVSCATIQSLAYGVLDVMTSKNNKAKRKALARLLVIIDNAILFRTPEYITDKNFKTLKALGKKISKILENG